MKSLSPSLLSADFSKLADELCSVENGGAKYIHLDIMDGHFVPNITFGAPILRSIRPITDMVFDVHLMIENPEKYLSDFANAGADILNVHVEACTDLGKIVDTIHSLGCKAGVTVKPDTPIEAVASVLDKVEMVLVMTVEPGFGGQKFMADMMPKVKTVRDMCNACGREDMLIQVDGGIDNSTAPVVAENGANVLVAGSALFSKNDYKEAVAQLRSAAESAAV